MIRARRFAWLVMLIADPRLTTCTIGERFESKNQWRYEIRRSR
jgi:hypothetical protein